uniref:hypothetical protein n=3 Tax=Pseudomonadota TaxID=1224 RepID=UPI001654AFEE
EALFRTVLSELDVMKRKSSTSPGPENLGTRERNTLLTVIASLVMALGDRLPDGYKRAEAIAGLTDQLGASVSVGTIDKILKQTAAAVDRRRGS